MWIRSCSWDAAWVLSGVPLGLCMTVALFLGMPTPIMTVWGAVVLELGHNLSPMVLAWAHDDYRRMMLTRKWKFVGLPIFLLTAGTACGIVGERYWPGFQPFPHAQFIAREFVSAFGWTNIWRVSLPVSSNPFVWLVAIYYVWNTYHFGMQNFGVMSLYRYRSGIEYPANQRRIDMAFFLTVQVLVAFMIVRTLLSPWALREAGKWISLMYWAAFVCGALVLLREASISRKYVTPRILFALGHAVSIVMPGMWIVAVNGINHWLVAIGLSSHVYARHKNCGSTVPALALVVTGVFMTALLFHKAGSPFSWDLHKMMEIAVVYMAFRLSVGFVHFLYDRWLYKLSDPVARTIIGRDLFSGGPPKVIEPFPALAD